MAKCFRGFDMLTNKCSLHSMPSLCFCRESSLTDSIPGGQWSGHANCLDWGAYLIKRGIPLRRLSVITLKSLCQYLKPDCLQARLPQRAAELSAAKPAPAFLVRFIVSKAVIIVNPNLTRVAFTVLNTQVCIYGFFFLLWHWALAPGPCACQASILSLSCANPIFIFVN